LGKLNKRINHSKESIITEYPFSKEKRKISNALAKTKKAK
jgi:hypothetical protein